MLVFLVFGLYRFTHHERYRSKERDCCNHPSFLVSSIFILHVLDETFSERNRGISYFYELLKRSDGDENRIIDDWHFVPPLELWMCFCIDNYVFTIFNKYTRGFIY